MTEALFPVTHLTQTGAKVGHRLHRIELYNWGTFDGQVHTVTLDGENTLLTGGNGTGKSTIVDALSTLLVPPHKVAYNKASGAEAKERNLASYVRGYFREMRDEQTGHTTPEALRNHEDYTVILAHFGHENTSGGTTIAQVMWFTSPDAPRPERLFVIAPRELTIAGDFAAFTGDKTAMIKYLQELGATCPHTFKEYSRAVRRALGIPTEQALNLFHQTMSMKQVEDLNDFVRTNMLEAFAADRKIDDVLQHYGDLQAAHEKILESRGKLNILKPIVDACAQYDAGTHEWQLQVVRENLLTEISAEQQHGVLTKELQQLEQARAHAASTHRTLATELTKMRQQQKTLAAQRDGFAGGRLAQLHTTVETLDHNVAACRARHQKIVADLTSVGIEPITSLKEWTSVIDGARKEVAELDQQHRADRELLLTATTDVTAARTTKTTLQQELKSLQDCSSNLPMELLILRERLCAHVGVGPNELPFAGEHLRVAETATDWELAAERVLRPLATTLLVPAEHYELVLQWVNDTHLGVRLIYSTVDVQDQPEALAPTHGTLAEIIDVLPSPFAPWLTTQLAHQANHQRVTCVSDFASHTKAVSRTGQVKTGARHEKDDRSAAGDRNTYVLGWDNSAKRAAAQQHYDAALAAVTAAETQLRTVQDTIDNNQRRRELLHRIASQDINDVDYWTPQELLDATHAEISALSDDSVELVNIIAQCQDTDDEVRRLEAQYAQQMLHEGELKHEYEALVERQTAVTTSPTAEHSTEWDAERDRLTELFTHEPLPSVEHVVAREKQLRQQLHDDQVAIAHQRDAAKEEAVKKMMRFLNEYPSAQQHVDASIAARADYVALYEQISRDGLPRHIASFEENLHHGVLTEIALLNREFDRHEEELTVHLQAINESLYGIDYNPGRYIRLNKNYTRNQEVRQFRQELTECAHAALASEQGTIDSHAAEETFMRIKKLLDRFQGRPGSADIDQKWRALVTDVRQWYSFSASENCRETNKEYETYSGSGGKSGGQKEKLAYTVLAASLAYQFKLKLGATSSHTFHLAVIDEAFGRSEGATTKYGMELFGALGLQLVLVTPLQKVNTISQYARRIVVVDKPHDRSRLANVQVSPAQTRSVPQALRASDKE